MKKLFALFILVLPVMGMFNDAEEYSDKFPKKNLICQLPIDKEICAISEEDIFGKIDAHTKYWLNLFVNQGYKSLPMKNDYEKTPGGNLFFYCFVRPNLPDSKAFFVDLSLYPLRLKNESLISFDIRDSEISSDKKWDFPLTINVWKGAKVSCNEMSWKSIDYIIHDNFLFGENQQTKNFIYESDLHKTIYLTIKKTNISSSFHRIFIANSKTENVYNIYGLYNNHEEFNAITKEFLSLLQKV
jgi:hypothetical protein